MRTFGDFMEAKSSLRVVFEPSGRGSGQRGGKLMAYMGIREAAYLSFYIDDYRSKGSIAHLDVVWTDPEYRSRGLAKRLTQEFVNLLRRQFRGVKHVDSEFMSRKAFSTANDVMGDPKYIGTYDEDITKDVNRALEMLPPDAQEYQGSLEGDSLNVQHKLPSRILKKDLRQFRPYYTQPELPFGQDISGR